MSILNKLCLFGLLAISLASFIAAADEPVDPGALLQEVRASLKILGEHRDRLEVLVSEDCAKAWSAGREAGYAKEPSGVSEMVKELSWLSKVKTHTIPGSVDLCKCNIEEIARYVLLAKEEFPKEGIRLQARCKDLANLLDRLKSKASIAESKLSFYKRWQSSLHPITIESPEGGEKSWKGQFRVSAGFCETVDIYLMADYVQPAIMAGEVKDGVFEGFLLPERRVWQGLAVLGKDSRGRVVAASEITWVRGSEKMNHPPFVENEIKQPETSSGKNRILSSRGTTEIEVKKPSGFKELSLTVAGA